jgi:membrane protein implicated in regulation of membrane protease activity
MKGVVKVVTKRRALRRQRRSKKQLQVGAETLSGKLAKTSGTIGEAKKK